MTPFPRKRAAARRIVAGPFTLPDFDGAAATAREPRARCHAFVWMAVGLFSVRGGAKTSGGARCAWRALGGEVPIGAWGIVGAWAWRGGSRRYAVPAAFAGDCRSWNQ